MGGEEEGSEGKEDGRMTIASRMPPFNYLKSPASLDIVYCPLFSLGHEYFNFSY